MVQVSLAPERFALQTSGAPGSSTSFTLLEVATETPLARFRTLQRPTSGPETQRAQEKTNIEWEALTEHHPHSDLLYLFSMLYFVEACGNRHLDTISAVSFHHKGGPQVSLPHPPQMKTVKALLSRWPLPLRVACLVEACELGVPIWTEWARSGELSYFDGVMSMASVNPRLAEDTIEAARRWLKDGEEEPLRGQLAAYRALHWPRLEDEWTCPENVYYSLYAPNNLAEAAIKGKASDALVCLQQAVAARATDGRDRFLGAPFVRAFLVEWWRRVVALLCSP